MRASLRGLEKNSQALSPDVIGKRVIDALQQMASELKQGALLTVDTNRTRLRLLPLRTSG